MEETGNDMKQIRIDNLVADIVSVTGTVNGETVVFAKIPETTSWTGTAERAENGAYDVKISAADSFGRASTFQTVIYENLELITDRTQDDVSQGTPKGFYNASDLNRVETAVVTISEMLTDAGWPTTLETKTNWQPWTTAALAVESNAPTSEHMGRYLANVKQIKNQIGIPDRYWTYFPISMDYLDWRGANAIEQALKDTVRFIDNIQQQQIYCGEPFSGEGW